MYNMLHLSQFTKQLQTVIYRYENGIVEQDLFAYPDQTEFSVSLVSNPQNEEQTSAQSGGRGGRTQYMDVELALRNSKVKIQLKYCADSRNLSLSSS